VQNLSLDDAAVDRNAVSVPPTLHCVKNGAPGLLGLGGRLPGFFALLGMATLKSAMQIESKWLWKTIQL
jgi:hypothetical protein